MSTIVFTTIAIIAVGVVLCITASRRISRATKEISYVRHFYTPCDREKFHEMQSEGRNNNDEFRDLRAKEHSLQCIIEYVDSEKNHARIQRNVGFLFIALALIVILFI